MGQHSELANVYAPLGCFWLVQGLHGLLPTCRLQRHHSVTTCESA